MALAQETPILLLDEPTTFLDIAHQIDVLELCADLPRTQGRTVVDGAARPQPGRPLRHPPDRDARRRGRRRTALPGDVITAELIEAVYDVRCRVIPDPETGTPLVVPRAHGARVESAPAT